MQCKFYAPDTVISKPDIDSFLSASGKEGFGERIIMSTTDRWNRNAEDLVGLADPGPPGGAGRPGGVADRLVPLLVGSAASDGLDGQEEGPAANGPRSTR